MELEPAAPTEAVAVSVAVDAETDRVALAHQGGGVLDVRELSLSIRVEDQPLAHQPPIPYFAADGFVGSPTGPFNLQAAPEWSTGERASLRIAGTNSPRPASGDRVTVTLTTERRVLVRASTVAR